MMIMIAGLTLFSFQNCSPSVIMVGSGAPVKANHLSEMLIESENEIQATKQELNADESSYRAFKVHREMTSETTRDVAVETTPEENNAPEEKNAAEIAQAPVVTEEIPKEAVAAAEIPVTPVVVEQEEVQVKLRVKKTKKKKIN